MKLREAAMSRQQSELSFCWWNLNSFAHFDENSSLVRRWPKQPENFEAKRDRILAALREIFSGGLPDLLAVCEVTREAAFELARLMSPTYDVAVVPAYPKDDGFQVAIIYRSAIGFEAEDPLLAYENLDVAEETRPMIRVKFTQEGQVIRFVACHWTSFDNIHSETTRERLADYLRKDTYQFLRPDGSHIRGDRHIVILGDLNEEPTSRLFEFDANHLAAFRDHHSGRRPAHWRDKNQSRVRLYNTSWRFLGEQLPYCGKLPAPGLAGTFYSEELGWRTLDHVIVSGGLLNVPPPYLDEANTRVVVTETMRSRDDFPRPFQKAGNPGISDHLPIIGKIILSEDVK